MYRFSNLQVQDEDNSTIVDLESATSSNGTACQQDSDVVRVIVSFLLYFKFQNLLLIRLCSYLARIFLNDT